jgi:hypothetical protein
MIVGKREVSYLHTIISLLHFLFFNYLYALIFRTVKLVFEVSHAGHHHYKPFFLTKCNAVFIAYRTSGLDKP